MDVIDLSKLPASKFYDQIKQIDSSVLIQLLKGEKDKKILVNCFKLINQTMGKEYLHLIKKAVR